jgi:hypothetical protein
MERVAKDSLDSRQAAAAWELCICYFYGFGAERDWSKSRHWLATAAILGLEVAQAFFLRIHNAMEVDTAETLHRFIQVAAEASIQEIRPDTDPRSVVAGWLANAVSLGCVSVIPDLRRWALDSNSELYGNAMAGFRRTLGNYLEIPYQIPRSSASTLASSTELLSAVAKGELEDVKAIMQRAPELLNASGAGGDTPLLIAARFGNLEILQHLLREPQIKVDAYNNDHQNVLHFLHIFDENRVVELVPMLIDLGADTSREGLPVQYSTDAANFSLPIRCCPLLNAIIRGSMVFLSALIIASHSGNSQFPCRVCEVGSRYRKLIAVAISLHSHKAIDIILGHLQEHGLGEQNGINGIEVWHQDELIPLRRVPFEGFALRGLDLPETFLRAIYHGGDHLQAMQKTIDHIVDDAANKTNTAYAMLLDSVRHDSSDALDYLLCTRFQRQSITSLALEQNFHMNPLFISIRLGLHSMFKRLFDTNDQVFQAPFLHLKCKRSCCLGRAVPRRHKINMTHLALSTAVTAAHCDLYFTYVQFHFVVSLGLGGSYIQFSTDPEP